MLKRKFISLFFAVAVATLMLLAVNEVMAECDISYSCDLVDLQTGNTTKYKIETYPKNGEWPVKELDGKYRYSYKLTGLASNQVTILIPVCCPDGIKVSFAPGSQGGQVRLPGDGDSSSTFGLWTSHEFVVRLAYAQKSVLPWPGFNFLVDKKLPLRNTSMQVKYGNSIYYCQSIAGPNCAGLAPYQTEATFKAGECEFTVVKRGGKLIEIRTEYPCYVSSSGTYGQAKIIFNDTEETVQYINDDTITETSGSPTCYTYWYGGQWRSICYGQ